MGVKYHVDYTFFDNWSNDMAYILGFWYADGSMEYAPNMRGHYIRVSSTDKEVIADIKNALQSKHTIVVSQLNPQSKKQYMLRIGNKRLFEALEKHGVTTRKSLTLIWPEVPREYMSDFVRGYFDGDGCVHVEINAEGQLRKLTTVFTSGSLDFLQSLKNILHTEVGLSEKMKIVTTKGGHSTALQLRYSTRDSLRLYTYMYPEKINSSMYLKRKYDIFNKYLRKRKMSREQIS